MGIVICALYSLSRAIGAKSFRFFHTALLRPLQLYYCSNTDDSTLDVVQFGPPPQTAADDIRPWLLVHCVADDVPLGRNPLLCSILLYYARYSSATISYNMILLEMLR